MFFFFSSRRRHTRLQGDWSSDVCSSDLDPPPSPIAEARAPRPPPEPRLQSSPVRDMEELRAREDSVLTSYGWVDRQAGIGRIPIDRAVELVLEKGLPAPPPAEAPHEKTARPRRARGEPSSAPPPRKGGAGTPRRRACAVLL